MWGGMEGGRKGDFRHTLDECPEQEQLLSVEEVKALNGIRSLPPARRVPRGDDFTATTFPSSIPGIFDRRGSTDSIHPDERVELQSQQSQRGQQQFQSHLRIHHAGQEICDLEEGIGRTVGKRVLCYVGGNVGRGLVDCWHTLDELPEQEPASVKH